ncbi:cytokinin hydroxylase-like [Heracleum sosnowskyi]|uniref:Cytokinin hydroxylase-like n=1 Tax=Heracleum sosnowskyi TaxID=360622 RepID=A0AAD8HIE1_9APIA|nr:cytokinin hydroxylase-like [Heracleum sosnowskyi]
MELNRVLKDVGLAMGVLLFLVLYKIIFNFWVWPNMAFRKLKRSGLTGPRPRFPLGNINDIVETAKRHSQHRIHSDVITHDVHPIVFPYYALTQFIYGKVFLHWLGTEPFLYVSDAEFLKQMSAAVSGKNWGKSNVFRNDRKPMFGSGLVFAQGEDWVRHRNVLAPAFSPANLKAMASLMVASTNNMIDRWTSIINSGWQDIEFEKEITTTTGEIIAKASFGMTHETGRKVLEKLRVMQQTLFNTNRYVGVPYSKYLCLKKYHEAKRLGDEIDALLLSLINDKTKSKKNRDHSSVAADHETNLLDVMLSDYHESSKSLTTKEIVDECKTFFFGGHETVALALTWTLFLLSVHPEWQNQLREEIKQVVGDQVVDANMLAGLKKMGWVMNESLRLYPPAPHLQRQTRYDIHVNGVIIPKEMNILIDVMAIMHDRGFWGDTVHQFRPERFEADDLYGGCEHKMGYVPFGFGGRMCIGRNLAIMEYKIVLTLILSRFSFSLSPYYIHSPAIMFTLRPAYGMPLVVQPLY